MKLVHKFHLLCFHFQDLDDSLRRVRDILREKDEAVARAKEEAKVVKQQELDAMRHRLIQARNMNLYQLSWPQ